MQNTVTQVHTMRERENEGYEKRGETVKKKM